MTAAVSVVIPVLDGARVLPRCLDALAAQRDAPPSEVIVVDNASTDDTAAVAAAHPVVARVVREEARGPYAARNAGIAAAAGAIVAFTDADCLPSPRWLRAGVDAIERAGADLVGGRIVQLGDWSAPVWERYDRAMYLDQRLLVERQGFAATANLFVRRDVVGRIGGFRPELVASGDVELGRRATAAGFRLVYEDDAAVGHHPRRTLRDTWALHRKLGSGFAELARAGLREPALRDPALRLPLADVRHRVGLDGPPVELRHLVAAHTVAMAARWTGRLTGVG